jgi:carbon-monoxide dehydrogenase small subunit
VLGANMGTQHCQRDPRAPASRCDPLRPPHPPANLTRSLSRVTMPQQMSVRVRVNGEAYERTVEPRLLLSDFLRQELGLTGTHVGCEHGVCGACTVLLDGESVRSCLMLTPQVHGREILTVEGLAKSESGGRRAEGGALHPLQAAFREAHGLQCGFCTPGMLMTLVPFLRENPSPTPEEIREAISGNLCRCTGYQNIVVAVQLAAERAASPPTSLEAIQP